MSDLRVGDFAAFFAAIHGHAPFRWQSRLLADVTREGRWPDLLDLPTGSGKTAALDVALFHLALDGGVRAPRRIVMVVDRRTVVDQGFVRAQRIERALVESKDPIVQAVAEKLRALTGDGQPLVVAQLRGGMPRDDGWARRPDQPLVALSTVDQVGSRVLFRGYGVSEGMRPIHAGLLGSDALLLLDEVHLSQPFLETLTSLKRYRQWSRAALPDRWQVVAMSATAAHEGADTRRFGLTPEDEADELLVRRLRAAKPVEIVPEIKVSGAKANVTFANACAERAAALVAPGKVVGVIVNRVDTARAAHAALVGRLLEARVLLVTGRMRPLDRDDRNEELQAVAAAGRMRMPDSRPVVVVSTQCIEAGADLDFDLLVTECASLDALRQRFGRLNRLGDIDDARGIILARTDSLEDDAVYGAALGNTWSWLRSTPIDFGVRAIEPVLPVGEDLGRLLSPKARAPVMLPSHLDAWAQTRPAPFPDPDISLWLHGVGRKPDVDVQVVWRGGLPEQLLVAASDGQPGALEAIQSRLEACAPVGPEAMALPVYAVRAWLAGEVAPEIADVEGASHEEERSGETPEGQRLAVLWQGDGSRVIDPGGLRPGMTIVVPAAYGGVSDGTWNPSAVESVADLAHRARWTQTRRPTLRLDASLLPDAWPKPPPPCTDEDDDDDRARVGEWLADVAGKSANPDAPEPERAAQAIVSELARARRRTMVRSEAISITTPEGEVTIPVILTIMARGRGAAIGGEDDGASHTGVEVTLTCHMMGVEKWAARFARQCGVPEAVARDIALAARWHDAGKVDPRFQRMLRGTTAFRADSGGEPLAKSAIVLDDAAARKRAREQSGYPRGGRHELASVALLEAHAGLLAQAADRDLLLHLVASHHGWCRPFAPCVPDREPVDLALDIGGECLRVSSDHRLDQLDSGVPDRFWRLTERYGWFGLAWLETLLRLADHRRSEEEQRDEGRAKEVAP